MRHLLTNLLVFGRYVGGGALTAISGHVRLAVHSVDAPKT